MDIGWKEWVEEILEQEKPDKDDLCLIIRSSDFDRGTQVRAWRKLLKQDPDNDCICSLMRDVFDPGMKLHALDQLINKNIDDKEIKRRVIRQMLKENVDIRWLSKRLEKEEPKKVFYEFLQQKPKTVQN